MGNEPESHRHDYDVSPQASYSSREEHAIMEELNETEAQRQQVYTKDDENRLQAEIVPSSGDDKSEAIESSPGEQESGDEQK
jgi:Spy/CpxP family protein refolding chaperone